MDNNFVKEELEKIYTGLADTLPCEYNNPSVYGPFGAKLYTTIAYDAFSEIPIFKRTKNKTINPYYFELINYNYAIHKNDLHFEDLTIEEVMDCIKEDHPRMYKRIIDNWFL